MPARTKKIPMHHTKRKNRRVQKRKVYEWSHWNMLSIYHDTSIIPTFDYFEAEDNIAYLKRPYFISDPKLHILFMDQSPILRFLILNDHLLPMVLQTGVSPWNRLLLKYYPVISQPPHLHRVSFLEGDVESIIGLQLVPTCQCNIGRRLL